MNKILNRKAGPVFRKETIRQVYRAARAMGYDFGRLKFTHRRRFERHDVTIGAELIIRTRDGGMFDQGVATIRDISPSGARLTDVATPLGTFPAEAFSVTLRPLQKPLLDVEIEGRIVRFHSEGQAAFGVAFVQVDSTLKRKLQRVAEPI
ncbi:MAG: PilZ domain-containing protein [Planctomycetes bacterium]|nr:PilZ domain-containing protein [Planctomycetota bacterium]